MGKTMGKTTGKQAKHGKNHWKIGKTWEIPFGHLREFQRLGVFDGRIL
jgi:hypothetical protein